MYVSTYSGLGDATSDYLASQRIANQNVAVIGGVGAGVTTAAVGAIAAHLAATGGSILGLSSAALSAAVPFIGPALMGATLLIQHLIANSGCGVTCVETSEWADQAAAALQQVLDGYFALPAPRTQTQKALAVANFQSIWKQLQAACGQPGTGDAGKRCISDRQSGACVWKQKYAPVYPGEPQIGECWNWFNGYLKPIQDDPVVPDSVATSASSAVDSIFGAGSAESINWPAIAVIGGLIALGVSL